MFIHTNKNSYNINKNYVTSIQEHQVIMDFPSIATPIQYLGERIVSLTYDGGTNVPVIRAYATGARLYLNV